MYFDTCRELNKKSQHIEINQCLDYIFEKKLHAHQNKSLLSIKAGSMKLEKFESSLDKQWPSVSDHCGLSIEIYVDNYNTS